jgi:hypothetical protein
VSKGKYKREDHKVEGAPGPFIIHAGGNKKKDEDCNEAGSLDDEFRFDPKYLSGLCNLDVDPNNPKEGHHSNPMNFDVRVTPNGSMDKQHFLDWSHHFVKNLPESQGKGKEAVFLTLDGHVSRSNLAAMRYLKENNVFVFFLPSHTSIWSQPNDCGVNLRFHACVEQVANKMRKGVSDAKVEYHNKIIRAAWELYLKKESDDYQRTGTNAASNAWKRTGLHPFNPRCEGWQNGIETFGYRDVVTKREQETTTNYEVKVRSDASDSILTEKERAQLRADGYTVSTNSCLEIASLRANQILSKWREHGKPGQEPCEMATTDVEKTVMKLFEFVSNRQINSEEEHEKRTEKLKKQEILKRQTRANDILTRMEPEASIKISKLTSVVGSQGVLKENAGTVVRSLGDDGKEQWLLFLRGEKPQTVTRAQLMDLKIYRLHIPAEHLKEKERTEKQRRNARLSTQERMHFEKEMQKEIEEEWKNEMRAQHVKLRLGHYDKFDDFLKLARSIKSPFTRDYTYESSYANKVKSVQITYHNNEFRAVPECVVNAAKVIILGLDEKSGKRKRTLDDGDGAGNGKKKERTLKGMFVAKRGGNMIECTHQLGKDERERSCNAEDERKKTLTKKISRLTASLTGFMAHKSSIQNYNLAQEQKKSEDRRNYWDLLHNTATIRKLFLNTFGPEKSGMLGKKKDVQLDFLNDRDKMGISLTKVQVDAYLDKLAMDLEAAEQSLERLCPAQPMKQPEAVPAAAEELIVTAADEPTAEDGSGSMELLTVIEEDGRPIELKKERSSEKPDVEHEADDAEGSADERAEVEADGEWVSSSFLDTENEMALC